MPPILRKGLTSSFLDNIIVTTRSSILVNFASNFIVALILVGNAQINGHNFAIRCIDLLNCFDWPA